MIVSIDRAWVIFVEKVTFWPRTPCVASQSHWFDPLLTNFGPCPARYIGSGRSAPKYEIDRLLAIRLGSHFGPLLPLAISAGLSACRSDFENVVILKLLLHACVCRIVEHSFLKISPTFLKILTEHIIRPSEENKKSDHCDPVSFTKEAANIGHLSRNGRGVLVVTNYQNFQIYFICTVKYTYFYLYG